MTGMPPWPNGLNTKTVTDSDRFAQLAAELIAAVRELTAAINAVPDEGE